MSELGVLFGRLAPVAVAGLITYAVHSTLLLGIVWLLTRRMTWRNPRLTEVLWKTALLGSLCTTILQLAGGFEPLGGRYAIAPENPPPAAQPLQQVIRYQQFSERMAQGNRRDVVRYETEMSFQYNDFTSTGRPGDYKSAWRSAGTSGTAALPWVEGVLVLWLTGILWHLLRYVSARRHLRKQLSERRPVNDPALTKLLRSLARAANCRRKLRLTRSARIDSPVALGYREICLPERALRELDTPRLRALLAHELAHLQRHDPCWLNLMALLTAVTWFQPLNRPARQRLQESAEYLCDEGAVQHTGHSLMLARGMVQVAGWLREHPSPVYLAGFSRPGSALRRRVERILKFSGKNCPPQPRWRVRGFAAALLVATALAAPVVSTQYHPLPLPETVLYRQTVSQIRWSHFASEKSLLFQEHQVTQIRIQRLYLWPARPAQQRKI